MTRSASTLGVLMVVALAGIRCGGGSASVRDSGGSDRDSSGSGGSGGGGGGGVAGSPSGAGGPGGVGGSGASTGSGGSGGTTTSGGSGGFGGSSGSSGSGGFGGSSGSGGSGGPGGRDAAAADSGPTDAGSTDLLGTDRPAGPVEPCSQAQLYTLRCQGTKLQVCELRPPDTTQGWYEVVDCAAGGGACGNGACVGGCAPGSSYCTDISTERRCASNGTWGMAPCPGVPCTQGSCWACAPQARRCVGNSVQQCSLTSSPPVWANAFSCTGSCIGGYCEGEPCPPGNRRCNGAMPETCDTAGVWRAGAACAAGWTCSDAAGGICAPAPTGGAAGTSGSAGSGGTGGSRGTGTAGGGGNSGGTTGGGGVGPAGTGGGGAAGTGAGGSGGGATCDGTPPCGGNVVGTWSFVSECVNEAVVKEGFMVANCPGATVSNVSATQSGSIAFTTANYTATVTRGFSYTLSIPVSCLGGGTCAGLAASLAQDATIQSSSCSGTATCICPLVEVPTSGSESGTYTTAGSAITMTPAGGTASSMGYCVQGDQFHLLEVETITNMGSTTMRTRSDQVAQRQSSGCDGGSCPSCTPFSRRCNNTSVEDCGTDGTWMHLQTCPYVCESGVCTGECVPGAKMCSSEIPMTCNVRGRWDYGAQCPFKCSQGGCVGSCNPGETRCADSQSVQYCAASSSPPYEGQWGTPSTCSYVCSGNNCGGVCKPGATRCSSVGAFQTCDASGQWGATTSCALGCFGGACVPNLPASCSTARTRSDVFVEDFESYAFGALQDVSNEVWLPTQGAPAQTTSPWLGVGSGAVVLDLDRVPFTPGTYYRSLNRSPTATPAKVSLVLENGTWAFTDSEYGVRFGLAKVESLFTTTEAVSVRIRNRTVTVEYPFVAPGSANASVLLTTTLDYDLGSSTNYPMTRFRAEIDFCAQTLTFYSKRQSASEVMVASAPIPAGLTFDAFFMGSTASFSTYVDNIGVAVEE